MSTPQQPQELPQVLPELCSMAAVFFLVLVGELLALVLSVARTGLEQFSWTYFGLVSLYTLWVILLSAGVLCRMRSLLQGLSGPMMAGISYAVVLLVTAGVGVAAQLFMNTGEPISAGTVATEVLIAAVFAGIAGRYLYVQQQLREQQKAELTARLEALQARIRPHFLFNSMNSIASLISVDANKAEDLVLDLSDLFRASMVEKLQVTLQEEMDFGRRYLRIEQARLGERLQVEWQVDDSCRAVALPALILQPLLENAVYHGVQPIPNGGVVSIAVERVAEQCQIMIINPIPTDKPSQQGNQMALKNIRYRLDAMFNGKAEFSAAPNDGKFEVCLTVPFMAAIESDDQHG